MTDDAHQLTGPKMIVCQLCGREFRFLPTHLRKAHGTDAATYRAEFHIPAGQPLASEDYSAAHAEKARRMQADGRLTYEHLPAAVNAARNAGRGSRTPEDLAKQSQRAQQVQPWSANQLPPGAKRSDGRDADKARQYQREYRAGLRRRKPDKD